jgi:DnaJ-class molecular chaperone
MSSSRAFRPCATCTGKGLDSYACIACKGCGKVLVYEPFLECRHCNGTGENQLSAMFISSFCVVCNGRGWALRVAVSKGAS